MATRRRPTPHTRQPAGGKDPISGLTPKQEAFVIEYLTDLNATQAAIRAGYSPRTAKQQGQRLLTNVDLAKRLREAQDARKEHARVASDRLEREAERIAVSDVRRLVRDGELLPIKDIPDDLAPAIASIEVVTKRAGGGEIEHVSKVRFWNKNDAIKTLFQLRGDGKVNDKNVNVNAELAARYEAARYEEEKAKWLRYPPEALGEYLETVAAAAAKLEEAKRLEESRLSQRQSTGFQTNCCES